jgi:glycosyltransferase involved in cell wall biosynthesis
MRIGIDTSQTAEAARVGCGQFAAALVEGLASVGRQHSYVLYATFGPSWSPQARRTHEVRRPNFERRLETVSQRESILLWQDPAPDFEDRIGRPDVVHSNSYFCPPILRRARLVYTVHDLISIDDPDYLGEQNRIHCSSGLFDASVRADLVMTVSDYTRRRFLEWFPHYPADRVRTVHEASRFSPEHPRTAPALDPPLVPGEFFLSVGTLEPRKNLRRLLRSYARLKAADGERRPLVIAGAEDRTEPDLPALAEDLGLGAAVTWLGYVDDATLCWLYANCFAFVYVSLAEGFGLPPLEAMSLGAPVLASSTTSIPEVCGPAALLVDPADETALCEGLRALARDAALRERLRDQARERAAEFSWSSTARKALRVYEEALAGHSFMSAVAEARE